MKLILEALLEQAFLALKLSNVIAPDVSKKVKLERTKDSSHGNFSSNLALVLAKSCHQSPIKLAELLVGALAHHPLLERVEIAAPGFINFFVSPSALTAVISLILNEGARFGCSKMGDGQKILLEFVSATPFGPLHVGYGRSAAMGAALANLLTAAGFSLTCEYYVNDTGRQMDVLAISVWLCYLALLEEPVIFPTGAVHQDYVFAIAEVIRNDYHHDFLHNWHVVSASLPADEPQGGDKEDYIDALIAISKQLLGESGFALFHQQALNCVLQDIKQDLAEFGILYDSWFSEKKLLDDGSIEASIQALTDAGCTYTQGGCLWFRGTAFGDEKDHVLVRANHQFTYFASDIAYHWNKYARGYDRVIDIFGADHHRYLSRLKAAMRALGHDEQDLTFLLVPVAILYRNGARIDNLSAGSSVRLRAFREEVGRYAARFFYVMRRFEHAMDFDLDLAGASSSDNPVYLIQYAHTRIGSMFQQLQEQGLAWDENLGLSALSLLNSTQEQVLIEILCRYPEVIESAAHVYEPHQVAYYLRELANALHSYYNAVTLICEQVSQRSARLCLLKAVHQVLSNGMHLLGVCGP